MRRRRFPKNSECYSCSALATDKEHVPAKSFFPSGMRRNLVTVPSCPEHNESYSKDVEYVRNMIVCSEGLNPVGEGMFETARRSFDRNEGLFRKSMRGMRPLGEEAIAFRFDLRRLRTVIRGIARAVYFNQNASRFEGGWNVLAGLHTDASIAGKPDEWQVRRILLDSFEYEDLGFPEPAVFRCEQAKAGQQVIYRLTFYEGFTAFAWTGPADRARLVKESGQEHRLLIAS
jgi:hypothetical protein